MAVMLSNEGGLWASWGVRVLSVRPGGPRPPDNPPNKRAGAGGVVGPSDRPVGAACGPPVSSITMKRVPTMCGRTHARAKLRKNDHTICEERAREDGTCTCDSHVRRTAVARSGSHLSLSLSYALPLMGQSTLHAAAVAREHVGQEGLRTARLLVVVDESQQRARRDQEHAAAAVGHPAVAS